MRVETGAQHADPERDDAGDDGRGDGAPLLRHDQPPAERGRRELDDGEERGDDAGGRFRATGRPAPGEDQAQQHHRVQVADADLVDRRDEQQQHRAGGEQGLATAEHHERDRQRDELERPPGIGARVGWHCREGAEDDGDRRRGQQRHGPVRRVQVDRPIAGRERVQQVSGVQALAGRQVREGVTGNEAAPEVGQLDRDVQPEHERERDQ